jgi:hypothetical protein
MAARNDQEVILVGVKTAADNARVDQDLALVGVKGSATKVRVDQDVTLVGVHQPNNVRILQEVILVMVPRQTPIASNISAAATVTATLSAKDTALAASINGHATVTALLGTKGSLQAAITGMAVVSATPTGMVSTACAEIDNAIIEAPGGVCSFALSDAITGLSQRLYDTTNQFWPQAELTLYIQEALREWNALTSYWRGDFIFPTVTGTTWYDITDPTIAPNSLRLYEFNPANLYTIIQYHLLEPPVGTGVWTGSLQFSQADLTAALQRRRDELIAESGCTISRFQMNANSQRLMLPNNVIDLRRIAFLDAATCLWTVLFETDQWGLHSFDNGYLQQPPGTPTMYSMSTEPWITFDTDVHPSPGVYEILTIEGLTASPSTQLNIPDDWTWVLKWGALSDLLGRESVAKDMLRQKYAEGRYRQGMALLKAAPAVLQTQFNGQQIELDAVYANDLYNTTWQNQAEGAPQYILTAGLNQLAVSPTSDQPYQVGISCVENAPVPVNPGDCILIGRDLFDVIIDEAQHIAAFKMGGAEFLSTMPLHDRFMQEAVLYNSKLGQQGDFQRVLYGLSQREDALKPRYTMDGDPGAGVEQ